MCPLVKLKKDCGTALTEFTIALPLFLMMIFSILDYTILMNDKIELSETTKLAARSSALLNDIDSTQDYANHLKTELLNTLDQKFGIQANQIIIGQKTTTQSDAKIQIYCQESVLSNQVNWTTCNYLTLESNFDMQCSHCRILNFLPDTLFNFKDKISIRLENEL